MRLLLIACLAVTLAAGEAPLLQRSDPTPLTYDLAATSPWMPLLWDHCTLSLSAGAAVRITAAFLTGTGIAHDATDLLALRDGYHLDLSGSVLSVASPSGHWTGSWSGGTADTDLIIDLPAGIDAPGILLACRQICYANLSGVRSLLPRRIGITISSDGVSSPELLLDVTPGATASAPMLRLDDVEMAMDATTEVRLQGWYASRAVTGDLRWYLTQIDSRVAINGVSGTLDGTDHDLDWFVADELALTASSQGLALLRYACSDGVANRLVTQAVTVVPPVGSLQVIGDFPFAVDGPTDITFLTSDANTTLVGCTQHPAEGSADIASPFTVLRLGRTLTLSLVPPALSEPIRGCAVFSNGRAIYRLPYVIRVPDLERAN
jgi:hypothetical protein